MINGRIVESYQFNGELLVIGFDNGKFLTIYPEENKIGWNVVSEWPMVTGKYENEYENIYFKFPGGEEVLWNWKDILDSFVGKQVAISVSDQFLFIFTRDGVEYMFDVLLDVNNKNSRFLFLSQA
ncbi:hypothetical protein BJL95_23400 [Methylomonas sp. LWB]|nr:hypothetical protein BJL95_23400 [Methylomonas sp. LWB]